MADTVMNATGHPLPHPTEISAPHWDSAKNGRLMVQRCTACEKYVFIPRPLCTHCLGDTLQWVESSGRGTIYSFTTIHRPQGPAFTPPYCAAIIELDEGWHMLSNIVDTPMDQIRIEMRVKVQFREVDGFALPMFVPDSASG